MADRYAYVPLIGLFIVTVWGISECSARLFKSSSWPVGIAACAMVALAISTSHQLSYWHNGETLFRQALTTTKNNYIAYDALGITLYEKGETDTAIPYFAKALEINPGYLNARKNLAGAEHNRGVAFALEGKQDEAIACYRRALEVQPNNAEFHYNVGLAMQAKGESQQATFHFAEAIRIQPNHFKAHRDLGSLFALQGRLNEAVTHYLKAAEIHPDPETYYNLGEVFTHQGRAREAAQYFGRALKLKPDHKEARQNLNNLLGRGDLARSAR